MKRSPSKILSVILLLSYLAVSTGNAAPLLEILCGDDSPTLSQSASKPFSAPGSSYKQSFKHFPPQAHNPLSSVEYIETIAVPSVRVEHAVHSVAHNDALMLLLLYSEGLRSPPGNFLS